LQNRWEFVLKDTILVVLNAEAVSVGAGPVTERALEDWIFEDLFEGPTERGLAGGGSEERYSPASLRAALEVVKLKAPNPERRNALLRIRLWLLDFHVPILRVTEDLKSEFERLLKRHFFRNPARYARSSDELSDFEKTVELRKAGPLDPSLADASLAPEPEDILKFVLESGWGCGKPPQLLRSLERLIFPLASERGQEALSVLFRATEPYVAATGIFGHPDWIEGSGLELLDTVSAGDLLKARRFYHFVLSMIDSASRGVEFLPANISPVSSEGLSKIVRSLRESDEWCVALLAAFAIAVSRGNGGASAQPNSKPG
jgi:hypothetical protein